MCRVKDERSLKYMICLRAELAQIAYEAFEIDELVAVDPECLQLAHLGHLIDSSGGGLG